MALSRNMIIGLVVLGVLVLFGALFGTLAATGVLGGQASSCTDSDDRCAGWASVGECEYNPDYMLTSCCASCKSLSDEEETIPEGSPAGSPSGTTTVSFPGCMDEDADNYNPEATEDDGSCIISGCMNENATNYNPEANTDDGSCEIPGCMNENATNYDSEATIDDGSCEIPGCMDENATNYNSEATTDDGSCEIPGCMDENATNYNSEATTDDGSCIIFRNVTVENKTFYSTYPRGTAKEGGSNVDFYNTPSTIFYSDDLVQNNLKDLLIGDASNIGGYYLIGVYEDGTTPSPVFAKKISRGNNSESANAAIFFSEDLYDYEADFINNDNNKFYVVKGYEDGDDIQKIINSLITCTDPDVTQDDGSCNYYDATNDTLNLPQAPSSLRMAYEFLKEAEGINSNTTILVNGAEYTQSTFGNKIRDLSGGCDDYLCGGDDTLAYLGNSLGSGDDNISEIRDRLIVCYPDFLSDSLCGNSNYHSYMDRTV